MAASSKHYGDLIVWIESIINSCDKLSQLRAVDKLIDSFGEYLDRTTKMDVFERSDIIRDLRLKHNSKEYNFYERKFGSSK